MNVETPQNELSPRSDDWKNRKARNHNALFIRGARRVGKSVLALELAHKEYKSFIKINLHTIQDSTRSKIYEIQKKV